MRSATAGFVLLWASIDGALYLAWYWGGTLDSGPSDSGLPPLLWTGAVAAFATALLGGTALQSKVLRVYGRPVGRWAALVGGAHLALWGASRLGFAAVGSLYSGPIDKQFKIMAVGEAGYGMLWALGLGFAIAGAVWGRSWPAGWRLWLAGRIVLQVLVQAGFVAWLYHAVFHSQSVLKLQPVAYGLQGLLLGAGSAWLLWRVVLPHPRSRPAGSAA